jgi:CrcB protein
MPYLLIACGGAIGACLRYALMSSVGNRLALFGVHMNYGTLLVNILGSFIMGMFIEYLGRHAMGVQNAHLFFAVGVLGSFTTFSTFSLDVIVMMQRGDIVPMSIYIILSVAVSIVGLFLGMMLMRNLVL